MKAFLGFFSILFFLLFFGLACAPLQVTSPTYSNYTEFAGSYPSYNDGETSEYGTARRAVFDCGDFPEDNNGLVGRWLTYYSQGGGRQDMRRYLERSTRYLALMKDIFREGGGMPEDLVYMAMVESGFYPYAKSVKGAKGYWQFIDSTGREYGLKLGRNTSVDDRYDFVLSTRAAKQYLRDLCSSLKDWRLSMAAYNAGETRVWKAIKKHRSKNFWYLVDQKALPLETRNFVPKILAMRQIALDPEYYGFHNLNYQPPLDYDILRLQGPTSLSSISRNFGIPHRELKSLNPKFKTDDIHEANYIRVPPSDESHFL